MSPKLLGAFKCANCPPCCPAILTHSHSHRGTVRHFPHSPADLSLLLRYITSPSFSALTWQTRYILLLWLSLIISIPFALDKFGSDVQKQLEGIVQRWLSSPGKEREATSTLAAKLYARKDVGEEKLLAFLGWAEEQLSSPAPAGSDGAPDRIFLATGILQFLCALVNSSTRQSFSKTVLAKLYAMCALYDPTLASVEVARSPLLRRLVSKYQGRLAGAYLPPAIPAGRRQTQARRGILGQGILGAGEAIAEQDSEVPEEVEVITGDLLGMLSDKVSTVTSRGFTDYLLTLQMRQDSRVRWTASKALARTSACLPVAFIDEIVSAILALFTENVVRLSAPNEDLSLVSASTWHGAALCLASFLRDTLLTPDQARECLPWVLRGLTFSQRKGAQKIGASVRDASCYFVWCAARASSRQVGLLTDADVRMIAQKLVIVACTDEEVSVRRAASAAYQECVGRLVSSISHVLRRQLRLMHFAAYRLASRMVSKCSSCSTA